MRKPKAERIRTAVDRNGIYHLTYAYRGYEYVIEDESDKPSAEKHAREQDLIDARIERQHRVEQVEEEIYNVDEIFKKLGWA